MWFHCWLYWLSHFSILCWEVIAGQSLLMWKWFFSCYLRNIYFLAPTMCHYRRRQWHPTPVLLPGKSHGWRSLVGCSPWGREESDTTERLHFHFSLLCIGEGNGNPLQCSCLDNPTDGVAQSWTWLKWLSSSMCHYSRHRASQVVLVVKNLPANAGDIREAGSISGSGRSPGEGHGNLYQYSCLENSHGQRSLAGYSP